jgi:hypothetical protein
MVQQEKQPSPPLRILVNTIIIEIDPRGKEFAMLIPQSDGFSNVVVWGYH